MLHSWLVTPVTAQLRLLPAVAIWVVTTARPGVHHGSAGNGQGSLVINELMSGRIYKPFNLNAGSYAEIALTELEWKDINNGKNPGEYSTPENPILVVEAENPVSVMNANWNDNWLAYGTGTLQPDPTINHTANYYERVAGESVYFSTYVSNEFNTLYNPVTTVHLPAGIDYTSGNYSTPSQLQGVTPVETELADGSWNISWTHGSEMISGEVYLFQVWGDVAAGLQADTLLQSTATTAGQDVIGSDFASMDSAVVNVGVVDEPAAVREVVINEVRPYTSCGQEWVEIHNLGTNDINIGGWELTDGDGFVYRFPELTFITNDAYLVVYLGDGADSDTELYTGAAYAHALGDTEDQLYLYNSSEHSSETMIDFVQWATGSVQDGADDDDAVAASLWVSGAFVPAPARDESLGRDRDASDTDGSGDWDNTGGPDAAIFTPGAINVSIPGADATPPDAVTLLRTAGVAGQEGAVRLDWQNPADSDFNGVRIVRSTNTHPDGLFDGEIVYEGVINHYIDSDLTPGEPVFYTLYAIDDAGNLSCPHQNEPTQAIPSQSIFVAFEDLKGWGWQDWDMNDLILRQDTAVALDGADVSQIEVEVELMARGGLFDHELYLTVDYVGFGMITKKYYNAAGVLQETTTSSGMDGATVSLVSSTLAAMPANDQESGTTNAVRGSGTRNGPTVVVTFDLYSPELNPLDELQSLPFDPWIRVKNTLHTIHQLLPGGMSDTQFVNGGPLYGRDIPFVLLFDEEWAWPAEGEPIWEAYPDYIDYVTSGGTDSRDWMSSQVSEKIWAPSAPLTLSTASKHVAPTSPLSLDAPAVISTNAAQTGWPVRVGDTLFASPLIHDLDDDGNNELISAAHNYNVYVWNDAGNILTGWPQSTVSINRSSPAIGDVDNDGDKEIFIGADNGKLFGWHHDGTAVAGFPRKLNDEIRATPVLVNLDGDARLEMVVATVTELYVLDHNGATFTGWPQTITDEAFAFGNMIISATPAVADMDADDVPEIVVGGTDGKVYAFRLDGSAVSPLWPQETNDRVYGAPVLVDLNEDGYRDVIAVSGDGHIYGWRGEGTPLPGFPINLESPLFASPAVVDLDVDGDLELVAATLDGRVLALHHDGTPVFNWPRRLPAAVYSSPVVGDIDGDTDPEVVVGTTDGNIYAWHQDGIPVIDFPLETNDWIVATPTMGDLDLDGDIEIAAGSYDGFIYVWDLDGAYAAEHVLWSTLGGDETHTNHLETDTPIMELPEVRFEMMLPFINMRP
jgi:LruC domain-containing protein